MNAYETPLLVDVEELTGVCFCATGGTENPAPAVADAG
jgi:hypothetical protein